MRQAVSPTLNLDNYSPYIVAELPSNLVLRWVGPHIAMPTILTAWGIIVTFQGIFCKLDYVGLSECFIRSSIFIRRTHSCTSHSRSHWGTHVPRYCPLSFRILHSSRSITPVRNPPTKSFFDVFSPFLASHCSSLLLRYIGLLKYWGFNWDVIPPALRRFLWPLGGCNPKHGRNRRSTRLGMDLHPCMYSIIFLLWLSVSFPLYQLRTHTYNRKDFFLFSLV